MSASASSQIQQAAPSEHRNVIVILRNQLPNMPPMRRAMGARASEIASSHASLLNELRQTPGRRVHSFSTINAFATSATQAEAAQLAANPMVLAVVPDAVIHMRSRPNEVGRSADPAPKWAKGGLCNTLEPEALQLTNTAFLDASKPQAQQVRDGNGRLVTGQGVKVAYIADGLDPNSPGFIRPDGSHVFIDYQDFSGDPAGTPTAGGEAFGDASSIAAQDMPHGKPLIYDISQFVNAAHPLPSPCNIHIRGMAPGASLVGLKVYSELGYTTQSDFVQAIEYAVVQDDVDVINESFSGAPFPDRTTDPISLANKAAVQAGVTVTVSTGDAGTAGTLGAPSTDPYVIAAGGSTSFRAYGQTGEGAQALANGYVSDNISSQSSGGFSQLSARTVDVVAPGDFGWALCSTNTALYTDCTNFASPAAPAPIQAFGGTSESAPLTAGEAALVIQAYRSTHGGADPSPALVKRIIMSTATDLGAPASEQGAGLINALAAVRVALSIHDANGNPGSHGPGLLADSNALAITDAPNTHESHAFKITNTGSTARHLTAALQTLGAPIAGATHNVHLKPLTDPTFLDLIGLARAYVTRTFTVPAGAQHLDAAIAWQGAATGSLARLSLLDPWGRQVAYSLPQGTGNGYGHVDVVKPASGKWTAIIFTRATTSGYSGPVQFTWSAENYVTAGSVHPATLDIAPGATESIIADFSMPATPGDLAAAIRFEDAAQGGSDLLLEIPVTLRSLIPVGPTGGSFTGTLTGGNGHANTGPTQTFEFDVSRGVDNLALALETADSGYELEGLLVDPNGMQLSVQPNLDPFGNPQYGLQLFHNNPQPGRWQFILLQNFYSSGNQTSLPYTARIGFNTAQTSASGIPNNPKTTLSASGAPVTATINVVNTGTVTEAYFADARLTTRGVYPLTVQPCSTSSQGTTLPGACAQYTVPTQTSHVQFHARSVVPIQMDASNNVGVGVGFTGAPDIFAKQTGTNKATATLSEPEVPYGAWIVSPALIGPYAASGAPTEPLKTGASALAQRFDTAVASDSGDVWADLTLGTSTFNPLVLPSGAGGTINVTITPDSSQVGETVSGFLYIDTFNPTVGTGDEVVRIPYSYTIVK